MQQSPKDTLMLCYDLIGSFTVEIEKERYNWADLGGKVRGDFLDYFLQQTHLMWGDLWLMNDDLLKYLRFNITLNSHATRFGMTFHFIYRSLGFRFRV